jgi:hypothetical protein
MGEFVRRETWHRQTLMGPVIVLGDKLRQQNFQLGIALPGLSGELFFKGANESFCNAIRLRAMACD